MKFTSTEGAEMKNQSQNQDSSAARWSASYCQDMWFQARENNDPEAAAYWRSQSEAAQDSWFAARA